MFDLVVSHAGESAETIRCELPHCFIGGASDCLVRLTGWRVPKYVAEVVCDATGVTVKPMLSEGLTVNGQATSQAVSVANSSRLKFKKVEVEIRYDAKKLGTEAAAGSGDLRTNWIRRVHAELLREMDLRRVDVSSLGDRELREQVEALLRDVLQRHVDSLPAELDADDLLRDVLNESVGLGPLEALLADSEITEIMVNRYDDVYIERNGKLQRSDVAFSNDTAVRAAIDRIVSPLGRRIDESSPLVDARLKDGSRVNAVVPPLALRGPCITIRKFATRKLTDDDLIQFDAATRELMHFLKLSVETRRNIVISGGTGSGKTTLLNVLSNYIPASERVVTVEDAAELKLGQPHLVSLEARPANIEGKGQVTIRDLVKNCLRMRPDRIVVGECRGGEALDMLQAMNTGHDGSLTTAHANSPRDALSRLEVMVLMAGLELPIAAIRQQISSAVDIIVQQSRLPDGSRKITSVCEVQEVVDGRVQVAPIYEYRRTGFDVASGQVQGHFTHTGHIPQFIQVLKEQGYPLDFQQFGWSKP